VSLDPGNDLIKLSAQEKQLVDAFVGSPNLSAQEAADKIGLATRTAIDVLKRDNVRRAVGLALLTEKKERLSEIRDHLVDALYQITTFDPADLFESDGSIRLVKDMPANLRAAIKGVKHGKYGLELVLVDRTHIQLELLKMVHSAIGSGDDDQKEGGSVLYIPALDSEEV
jgi:hypothetical protein